MTRTRLVVLFALVLAVTAAIGSAAESASAAFPGRNGLLVYTFQPRAVDGFMAGQVAATITAGGARRTQLTPSEPHDAASDVGTPTWSPDGKRILFSKGGAIFVMGAKGGGRKILSLNAPNAELYSNPSWSPDGRRLAFQTIPDEFDDDSDIWVAKLDGSGLKHVITNGQDPVWSPDGNRIAFVDRGARCRRIRSINPDGTGVRTIFEPTKRISPGSQSCQGEPTNGLDISPDGLRLAFGGVSGMSGQRPKIDLFLLRLSGTPKRLTKDGFASDPSFSPEGRTIAFDADGVRTIPAGGGKETVVTRNGGVPSWQPLPR